MTAHRPASATNSGIAALGELCELAAEIEAATQRRELLIHAARAQGCRLTDIATATGLSRSMIARMTGARR